MNVLALYRYPVKSMLGEELDAFELDGAGVVGDREFALLDAGDGRVATAKQPRHWRALLQCRSTGSGPAAQVTLPDGRTLPAASAAGPLSELLGRQVVVSGARRDGAVVERPDAEAVLAAGLDAEIDAPLLEIAQGTEGGRFVDHSPVHLISTATLDALGVDALRYRPNIVVATPAGTPAFVENDWLGRTVTIGGVTLVPTLPTPRCVVPTLEHGDTPRAPEALRGPAQRNRVEVEGFGVLPCAGCYARVEVPGTVRRGDAVQVTAS